MRPSWVTIRTRSVPERSLGSIVTVASTLIGSPAPISSISRPSPSVTLCSAIRANGSAIALTMWLDISGSLLSSSASMSVRLTS